MVIVCAIIPIIFVNCHVDIHTNAIFVINYIQQANVGMVVVVKIILMRYTQGNNFRAFRGPSQPRSRFNQSGPRSFQSNTRFIRPPIRFPNSIPTFKR